MRVDRLGTLIGLWALFLAVECGAQLGLKLGSDPLTGMAFGWDWLAVALSAPWVQFGILCYLLAFVLWMLILDKMELSLAFPLSGMVYVVVMAASALGLHETPSPLHWAGVGLIVTGVVVLGRD